MASLFRITGNAIPTLLAPIPAYDDNQRCRLVHQALSNISVVYKTQLNTNLRIDWSDPVNQCAYVFLYFAKHSHLVYETMFQNASHFESAWRNQRDIKVCSIGGGPGSEIAGIVAFLNRSYNHSVLRCSVLDLYPEWERSWQAIRQNLTSSLYSIDVNYRKFNFLGRTPLSAEVVDRIRNADMVTFIKSLSAVDRAPTVYSRVVPAIMNNLKPGAFVLFIDNSAAQRQNDKFKQIALDAGLNILQDSVHDTKLSLPSSGNMQRYSRRFDYHPLRECSVTIRLMRKPGGHIPVEPIWGYDYKAVILIGIAVIAVIFSWLGK